MKKRARKKERNRIPNCAGQTGWPSGPIQSLNPLHHAVRVADPGTAYGGECRSSEFLSDLLLSCPSALEKPRCPAKGLSAWPAPDPGLAGQTQGPQSGIKKQGFGLGRELRSLFFSPLLPPCCSFNLGGEGRGGEVQSKYRII